jgi:hypothetical protein
MESVTSYEKALEVGKLYGLIEMLKWMTLLDKHRKEVVDKLSELRNRYPRNAQVFITENVFLFISRKNEIVNFFISEGSLFSEEGCSIIEKSNIATVKEALIDFDVRNDIQMTVMGSDNNELIKKIMPLIIKYDQVND